MNKNFRKELETKFQKFIKELIISLQKVNLDISDYFLDHVCFRVESDLEYTLYKSQFSLIGEMLVESIVGGRSIATFKLFVPFEYNGRRIDVVELPQPKKNNSYKLGFEHAEFVIKDSFKDFAESYPQLSFDWEGSNKSFNPELRYKINEKISVKFHHQSLEDVVKEEQKSILT